MLRSMFSPDLATLEERRSLLIFQTEREIAAYVDRLDLGDGDRAHRHRVCIFRGHGECTTTGSSSSPRTATSPVP